MTDIEYLYVGNDNYIGLSALTNPVTGTVISDATVNVTITDTALNPVDGSDWPVVLNAVVGTAGKYGKLISGLTLMAGKWYLVNYVIVGDEVNGEWQLKRKAVVRRY